VGTSQGAKAASHDRILDIAAARVRRHGFDRLAVAEIMKAAGLTYGGFYRHFDSREHLVAKAAQRALNSRQRMDDRRQARWAAGAYTALVDHPESGCGVAGVATDVARAGGSARGMYSRQVRECLAVLADLIDNPDREVEECEAVLTLSVLVGAISLARAVDDPDLSEQILTNAAVALKRCKLRGVTSG
jgi:TetR/AcrR family transcriptional repressor of nem operon